MPPLPSSLDQESLALIDQVERRKTDLNDYQLPRLRNCQGPLSVQQDLAAELREDIDTFASQVETLELLVPDQKGIKNRRELGAYVDGLKDALLKIRKDSREAILYSKRAIDSQAKSHREELLSSSAATEKRGGSGGEDALMRANNEVTDALRRTIGVMQGELERSVLSSQMLDDSSASLRATSSTHDTLTNVMGTSKQLITALEKSDWLDRVLILSAVAFFIIVVLFILKERFVDRTLRIAFWWTRFLPSFGSALSKSEEQAMSAMEEGSMTLSSLTVTASSLVSAVTATASAVLTSAASELNSSSIPWDVQNTTSIDDFSNTSTSDHAESTEFIHEEL